MVKKTKVKLKPKFFIFLFFVLTLIGAGVYFMPKIKMGRQLEQGTLRLNHETKTIILRDEICVMSERYDKILFYATENANVSVGDQIAEVFKWGYQEETMQTLLDLQKQIYEHQITLIEDVVNPELDSILRQCEEKEGEIRTAVEKKEQRDILLLEQELKDLLKTRADLLKNIVQPDERLSALYDQEAMQINNLSTWKRDMVNTVGDGIVSFYFDGYELSLQADKLSMLTPELVAEVIKGAGAVVPVNTTVESPLYRVINPTHFYIAFLTESANPFRLISGENYTVVFNGHGDQPFIGTAHAPIIGQKQVVNILEFNQDVRSLLGARVVDVAILKDANGIVVPKDAIAMRDNVPGIILMNGDDAQWTQVDVLAVDENSCVVRSARQDTPLQAGGKYKKP